MKLFCDKHLTWLSQFMPSTQAVIGGRLVKHPNHTIAHKTLSPQPLLPLHPLPLLSFLSLLPLLSSPPSPPSSPSLCCPSLSCVLVSLPVGIMLWLANCWMAPIVLCSHGNCLTGICKCQLVKQIKDLAELCEAYSALKQPLPPDKHRPSTYTH